MPSPEPHNESILNPVWSLRVLALLATLSLALATLVFKTSPLHEMCVGGALGLLVPLCVFTFSIKGIAMKEDTRKPDVESLPIS